MPVAAARPPLVDTLPPPSLVPEAWRHPTALGAGPTGTTPETGAQRDLRRRKEGRTTSTTGSPMNPPPALDGPSTCNPPSARWTIYRSSLDTAACQCTAESEGVPGEIPARELTSWPGAAEHALRTLAVQSVGTMSEEVLAAHVEVGPKPFTKHWMNIEY